MMGLIEGIEFDQQTKWATIRSFYNFDMVII